MKVEAELPTQISLKMNRQKQAIYEINYQEHNKVDMN